jgi:hypothetical protein
MDDWKGHASRCLHLATGRGDVQGAVRRVPYSHLVVGRLLPVIWRICVSRHSRKVKCGAAYKGEQYGLVRAAQKKVGVRNGLILLCSHIETPFTY